MNKENLVRGVASRIDGATKKDITLIVDEMINVIKETVASGEKVSITGFGTFEMVERAAKTGRNPRTGEVMEVAASKAPKFKPSKLFKEAVNV